MAAMPMTRSPVGCSLAALVVACMLAGAAGAAEAVAPWLDAGWSRRVSVTARPDSISGAAALSGFPMLVQLSGSQASVFAQAATDGRDLRFTTADGVTLLDAEVVGYDAGAQQAEIWVRAATLSKVDNQFFLYYGNPLAGSASTDSVWTDYKAVYHFEQDPSEGILLDACPARAHASTSVSEAAVWARGDLVAGRFGRGWRYDTNKTVLTNKISVASPAWNVSAWLRHDTHGTDFVMQAEPCTFHLASQASDVSWDVQYSGGYCGVPPDYRWRNNKVVLNQWHHYAWVYDGASQRMSFYYDGIAQSPFPIYPSGAAVYGGHTINPDGSSPVSILGPLRANGVDEMNGVGDEFRVRAGGLTAGWLQTEFRNQQTPQQFFSFGQEEQRPGPPSSWGGVKSRFR